MTFYQALTPALQEQGVAVRVIEGSASYAGTEKSERVRNGVSVETLEFNRLRRWQTRFSQFAATPGLQQHLAAAWAMWEQAQFGESADIVEACDWGLLFAPVAIEGRRPLIVQCHGSVGQIAEHDPMAGEETQSILIRLLERALIAELDVVQSYSCANTSYWQRETGRDALMIRPAWSPPPLKRPSELSTRGLVVGRVQRWKGPETVCQALQSREGLEIDWVGRDTAWGSCDLTSTAHLARVYPGIWGKRVAHHPPLGPEQVRSRQAAALFNLVPSTWDVFNFTAVEAMASGRPTIVSSGAGAHELIQDAENGYTFPSGDVEGLSSVIARVLGAPSGRLIEIANAARETVSRSLEPRAIAKQRIAAYRSAIERWNACRDHPVSPLLRDICRPNPHSSRDDVSFLKQIPLRALVRHIVHRAGRKAGVSAASESIQ